MPFRVQLYVLCHMKISISLVGGLLMLSDMFTLFVPSGWVGDNVGAHWSAVPHIANYPRLIFFMKGHLILQYPGSLVNSQAFTYYSVRSLRAFLVLMDILLLHLTLFGLNGL